MDINDDGLLLVEKEDGNRELISSGEVSIRGEEDIYNYCNIGYILLKY